MIRRLEIPDIGRAMEIWLDSNIRAHGFIPAKYWEGNFEPVREMLPQAEVYVYEEESRKEIQGFIGLDGSYIAGIFVWHAAQSRGIGKRLLDLAKGRKKRLDLSVYQKNTRAVRFYQREGFQIRQENTDGDTGEKEYLMRWETEESK